MIPPSKGPRVGPRRGPRRYHPKIPALSLGSYISLMVPPPFAIDTAKFQSVKGSPEVNISIIPPKNPLIVRNKMRTGKLFARAEGI